MKLSQLIQLFVCVVSMTPFALAQVGGIGLNPGKSEIEIMPGQEKTVAFLIESPPGEKAVTGRLTITPSDWTIAEDASVSYVEAGSLPDSAADWMVFSPSDVSIASGQVRQVRVTVRVPEGAEPGVYRTGLMVQEREPASPPEPGQHRIIFRFRYVYSLYVVVPPVTMHGELEGIELVMAKGMHHLVVALSNQGTRHLRPVHSVSIKSETETVASANNVESTVLLPHSKVREAFALESILEPGTYEVSVRTDFGDGRPIQQMTRPLVVGRIAER